jgi:hypothetical protein
MAEPPLITDPDQVLKQRGSGWQVLDVHPTLSIFLSDGGDYSFWVTEDGRDDTILSECGGGNATWWELIDEDTVELTFQWGSADGDPVRIKRDVLWTVIERLTTSRHIRERLHQIAVEWKKHHLAWLEDPRICPLDRSRKNCSDSMHEAWERDRAERERWRARRSGGKEGS